MHPRHVNRVLDLFVLELQHRLPKTELIYVPQYHISLTHEILLPGRTLDELVSSVVAYAKDATQLVYRTAFLRKSEHIPIYGNFRAFVGIR